MIGYLIAWAAGAYAYDVVLRPAVVAKRAQAEAARRGKPVLNVGAGTRGSSLRVAMLGPTMWGHVNCDIAGPEGCVAFCDAHKLPYPDRYFGAAIASHVLEHVENPQAALAELQRVADVVYVITPVWWAPHTWAHPGHRWYRRADGSWMPLWQAPTQLTAPIPVKQLGGRP